jgi:homoserine kinase
MTNSVRVAAPATTANLGPGFDAAGLALDWWDTIEVQLQPDGERSTSMRVTGAEAELLATGPGNLVRRSMAAFAREVSAELPAVHILSVKGFPLGRGFGSSAAAVVLGVLAARALLRPELPDAAVLALAAKVEGHPDNVAPCLLGGGTLCWQEGGQVDVTSLAVHPDLTAVALVSARPLATRLARRALPAQVPFEVAAHTAGRAALLAPALAGDFDLLLPATDDVLHQPARLGLDAQAKRAVEGLRERGHAAFLSGAGPSVVALCRRAAAPAVLAEAEHLLDSAGGWRAAPVELARSGALASVQVAEV